MPAMSRLSEQEKSKISERAEIAEARTGVQVLAAVAGKSDTYPEVPWKAFSLGTAVTALGVFAGSLLQADGVVPPVVSVTAPLAAGMVLALAVIFLEPAARLFLGRERAAAETKQYAQSLFLERRLSRTKSRRAVLVLVSRLERRSAIVADEGLSDTVPAGELERITASMDAVLAKGSAPDALLEGLAALEELFLRCGLAAAELTDELSEEFLETEGPNS